MTLSTSSIPVTWDKEYNQFNWQETYMIDEVPADDIWDTFATRNKLKLEDLYRRLNMPKETGKHYMCLDATLSNGLTSVLDNFVDKIYHYNFLKLTPGYNLWWHYDSYPTFVRYNNIAEQDAHKINRTIVMLNDWAPGQIFQANDEVAIKWTAGTTYTWPYDTWHGVANFGFNDVVVMQITWIDK
tara:strand:+ start:517 stop:1071 length:555 start_codon:yes stop_codon:yes gene_type:complete